MTNQESKSETLRIDNIAMGGDGVGRLDDGRVCFVDAGFPTEVVRAEITEEKKSFSRARVTELVEQKFDEPVPCPVADECGGCRFWRTSYERELEWKFDAALSAMRRIAGDVAWPDAERIAAPRAVDYRSRAELRVDRDGSIGFLARASDRLVPTDTCPILRPELDAALAVIGSVGARYGAETAFVEWDEVREHVVVEYRMDAALAMDVQLQPAEKRVCIDAGIGSIVLRPRGKRLIVLGDGMVHRYVFGSAAGRFVSEEQSGQFAQAFRGMNEQLVALVADELKQRRARRLLDLFAGAGNLSLGAWVDGVELVLMDASGPAIEAAKRTVRRLDRIGRAPSRKPRTIEVDLHRPTDRVSQLLDWCDTVLLDPPRGGLSKGLRTRIARSSASAMIYVSCDPPALARDVQSMAARGWTVDTLRVIDLFPRTPHCEVVATLHKAGAEQ